MTASTGSLPTPSVWVRPASLLTSGYVITALGDITEWAFVSVYDASEGNAATLPNEVDQPFRAPEVQTLLARLAATFDEFFHMTVAEWEADLRNTARPVTVLQLWNTVADVFDYYTRGKKLRRGARADYLRLILRFSNHPGTCLDGVTFNALTPGRAKRVVAEMEHFFQRRLTSRCAGHHET